MYTADRLKDISDSCSFIGYYNEMLSHAKLGYRYVNLSIESDICESFIANLDINGFCHEELSVIDSNVVRHGEVIPVVYHIVKVMW